VFLDGPIRLHQLVKEIAPIWLKDTDLKFSFYSEVEHFPKDTHIRISFSSHNGSQLGDHNDYFSQLPTMNLNDLLGEKLTASGTKRLILHEFGHALGFEHEYRSYQWPYGPSALQQVLKNCYPKMEAIGYSKLGAVDHCSQINSQVGKNMAHTTAYDERSIMNYSVTFILEDGTEKTIQPTYSLSLLDRYAIQRWYGSE